MHVSIYIFNLFIVKEHSVCSYGEPEELVVLLCFLVSIIDELLYDFKIQKRLSSEKVHLKISPASGISYQIVKRLLSYLKAHKSLWPIEISLACKAVPALEIAVMSHVKAHSLYYRLS